MKKITYLLALLVAGPALAQEDCNLQYDGNGDGAVNVEDVLGVLSEFGEVCEPVIEYGPCGPDSTVSYHGYDYGLVEIGEQCWFAENLRAEHYANGDSIPANLSNNDWSTTTNGAVTVYGEAECLWNSGPYGDTCDPDWCLNEYGRLYNWYAVNDERGLCPTGWHVPTDVEWMALEIELGMSESEASGTVWRGTDQGTQMKTTYGWVGGGNGTNTSGFSGLPGGARTPNGYFFNWGEGQWWTSSLGGSGVWIRNLADGFPSVARDEAASSSFGFSVRCIKD